MNTIFWLCIVVYSLSIPIDLLAMRKKDYGKAGTLSLCVDLSAFVFNFIAIGILLALIFHSNL